jgi:hypothetical protein
MEAVRPRRLIVPNTGYATQEAVPYLRRIVPEFFATEARFLSQDSPSLVCGG